MKTPLFFGVLIITMALLYSIFPRYYFAAEPLCVASFKDLSSEEAYEQAVLQTLRGQKPSDFRYFFQTFLQEDNKDYLVVNMRNKDFCFHAKILVENWDKLAGMKRTNGASYPKELYQLEWEIVKKDGQDVIFYKNMRTIID